ncbi:type VI secretion system tip protein VgrG [Paraburkholderia sp. Tr-20389]|uniref:type VI secretion system Vgr family protein n=1 Tax=Paraburkholderia sp. Tr-20389 TaxID=2703903 RepID=UPI00197FA94C|nr:type VI secretion system tip protein TssI/VgrG [Paraburkholderia sp. Tr-20389]MBN3752379.1 type VI secretion system tip protein VgrG [Paraburkholderia sp. Tr-20389]
MRSTKQPGSPSQGYAEHTITIAGAAIPLAPSGEPALLLRRIQGTEALSEIYSYTLDCCTPLNSSMPERAAANLDLRSMIGKELTVSIQLDGMGSDTPGVAGAAGTSRIGAGTRQISGIVTQAHYVGQTSQQSHYRLIMKPWLWLTDQRSDFRIFQGKTVVEIIEQAFDTYMYSYETRLSETYPVLDYQVQYGETDFRFIQRLMAEHGIYWFFEHSDGFHRLILVDHLGAHRPVESAAYRTLWYYPPGHKIDREYIDHFDLDGSLQSGRWTTNDFDFKKPAAVLLRQNELTQQTAHNDLERYEWPGDYTNPSHGEQFARWRMEQMRGLGERERGAGNVRDVVCGTTFRLAGHPHDTANREYLVIGSSIAASEVDLTSGPGHYSFAASFVTQPATTVFRPPRNLYPKPRTSGPQTAIVTGPPGEEIWTDQYGRVKLSFHWDRSGIKDQSSSCWIRVAYPWTGPNYGAVHIPRVGTEVIVDFENGDPDRPIVIGRVYNAESMPPWPLPGNATQSGILTRSTKNGGYDNANALRFEDRKGSEEVWLHAEKDQRIEVEHDESHWVGNDRRKTIDCNETVKVGMNRTETVGMNETIAVGMNRTEAVGMNETVVVGLNRMITTGFSQEVQVGIDAMFTVGAMRDETVGANYQLEVGANWASQVGNNHTHAVQQTLAMNAGKAVNVQSGGTASYIAQDKLVLQCGQASITLESNGNVVIGGTVIGIQGAQHVGISGAIVDLN